ncbi:oxidoreductase [Nocardioides seonyuensis]|uniref:Oxidoreductase n=1 Tax=Nocardioides seonyuensis TaxID=2518371 RepID=A0A4P7ICH3_9ACTN|nr:molybdopterin-dependent oxidoreductase [Nocardioides seonyuensis]QBX54815.1 oxidoreductase [Nocardioides seonyuensis]
MSTSRMPWVAAGIVAGLAGLATSYAAAMVLTIRASPFVAVADLVVRHAPGSVTERAIDLLGSADKPVLVIGMLALLLGAFAWAGLLARGSWWKPVILWFVLAGVGLVAVLLQRGAGPAEVLPVAAGLITWITLQSALTDPLRRAVRRPDLESRERRVFLLVAGAVAVAGTGIAIGGRVVGSARRHVETSRRLLRIDGVTRRPSPASATIGVRGVSPWQTPNDDFYRIDTAISVPTIEPAEWSLRIHGLVDRELVIGFDELVSRKLTESWVTLSCVSNPVGGDLVGNARWSGVRIADLLAEAGVREGADCVRQTSHDGWDCATPLAALTDDRDAMLAVAMNGRPLPIEHGFPVRSIVPGLYGYVSATKWVVDFEVTRFADVDTFWTVKGWAEQGPAKIASRIDVPRSGADVPAGQVTFGGVAWHQHTGIDGVEVSLDGRSWERAELAEVPSVDTWVQWALTLDVPAGDHGVRVRAIGADGETQTGVRQDVVPDGATGWHTVEFTAT